MDVFRLRDSVVDEYRDYVESFVNIHDERVSEFVRKSLAEGELWPDPALQLNPAYAPAETLGELAAQGVIREETASYFGHGIRLYRHQREALDAAQRGANYVVTTGTGSGKSLTYLVPIYDAIVRAGAEKPGVRAVLVYPMNALINSQEEALKRYAENFPGNAVRFAQYTGQTPNSQRNEIINNPPHILLTNYVMLEYLLLRPTDRSLLATATRDVQFIVMDELHFYRGRQGADVAMLLRRLSRHASRDVRYIGTSATVASEGTRDERKQVVAGVAKNLFGAEVRPDNVIDETLVRVAQVDPPATQAAIRAALDLDAPKTLDEMKGHPLAAWIEFTFGLSEDDEGRLVRHEPQTFKAAVEQLEQDSGLPVEECERRLQALLEADVGVREDGEPTLAFRLHQFLSSGSSVYATLEDLDERELQMESRYKLDDERLLFPLSFCRECGQDYYLVTRTDEGVVPRLPLGGYGEVEDEDERQGYFAIENGGDEGGNLWDDAIDDLPDSWLTAAKRPRLKREFAEHRPEQLRVSPSGGLAGGEGGVSGWFQPAPLLVCLRCRVVYDRRQGQEFRKLASLSQTGRSTATTLTTSASVSGMLAQGVLRKEAKALSFTDNRQDASLQAGHLNDFVQTAQVRAGLIAALERRSELGFAEVGYEIFNALNLRSEDFLAQPVDSGPGWEQGKETMARALQYRALEDLSRGWRIVQPNLEQVGLLKVRYRGLDALASDNDSWTGVPRMNVASPEKRGEVLTIFLDHLRMQLAIEAHVLSSEGVSQLQDYAGGRLREPWAIEQNDQLREQSVALLPGVSGARRDGKAFSLGGRSAVARYLRSERTWGVEERLDTVQGEELVDGIVRSLNGHILRTVFDRRGNARGVRILADSICWTMGDGQPAPPDPVRTRDLHLRREQKKQEPNSYFSRLYQDKGGELNYMLAREHTGQVTIRDRQERERDFRAGKLPLLFCSPTMELGVDISELQMVHMRNIPPTPANYAQRSGRAGRGGKAALIAVFAANGNAHDQHYFRRRNEMIAGAVAPARMDLRNKELIESHIHSLWLAEAGVNLGISIKEILDLEGEKSYPIKADVQARIDTVDLNGVRSAAYEVVERTPEVKGSRWYSAEWLEEVISRSGVEFDDAFEHWRELYGSTMESASNASMQSLSPTNSADERKDAERRYLRARRELNLLLNESSYSDSDFYPYRYLATQGFLPGYNFPRLPVRTLVARRSSADSDAIDRPRFLGLTEFGPLNTLYHEGRKHQVNEVVLPVDGIGARMTSAKICMACDYIHDGEPSSTEICERCSAALSGQNVQFPQRLLDMPTSRARPRERISSEEEERIRSGYEITTHYRFQSTDEVEDSQAVGTDAVPIATLTYAPSADVWRINHGWRSKDTAGFILNPQNGRWLSQGQSDDAVTKAEQDGGQSPLSGVKPFVRVVKNIIFIKPSEENADVAFLTTLSYALRRGIQFEFQVEESEIEVELVGSGEQRHILLCESAEGGIGIGERLMDEPDSLSQIARKALSICHYDPERDSERDEAETVECVSACYECLMSYSNQRDHSLLDRRLVKDFLFALAVSKVERSAEETRNERFNRLHAIASLESSLEGDFIQYLYENGHRLPDKAQYRPGEEIFAQADFYYEKGRVCVFVDGPHHDGAEQTRKDAHVREELEDMGYRILSIRYDLAFKEQVADFPEVFGEA